MKDLPLRASLCLISLLMLLGTTGCSLVTVPVKTTGTIVNTTVKTAGKVATAPIGAISRD